MPGSLSRKACSPQKHEKFGSKFSWVTNHLRAHAKTEKIEVLLQNNVKMTSPLQWVRNTKSLSPGMPMTTRSACSSPLRVLGISQVPNYITDDLFPDWLSISDPLSVLVSIEMATRGPTCPSGTSKIIPRTFIAKLKFLSSPFFHYKI